MTSTLDDVAIGFTYADALMGWLKERGYTHCFLVAGGAAMHLIDAARKIMTCIPVMHEVTAGISADYFNETSRATKSTHRAFALVTAGPGLTNIVTAMAGAYVESRDLLVIGGQVKSTDLKTAGLRQRGMQEVDGVSITSSVTVAAARLERPEPRQAVMDLVNRGLEGRLGPVFLEVCLDVQGAPANLATTVDAGAASEAVDTRLDRKFLGIARDLLSTAHRPLLLIGGGVSRGTSDALSQRLEELALPTMTTWTAADRLGADHPCFMGRPGMFGQRFANVLLEDTDLVVAVGTHLSVWQTGFAWDEFAPNAKIIHIDSDPAELTKGHPEVELAWHADPEEALMALLAPGLPDLGWSDWLHECQAVRELLPLAETKNVTAAGFQDPYKFALAMSEECTEEDVIVPCSSGGAMIVTYQAFRQKHGQIIMTSYKLASMGYGLAGAIGASMASGTRRTILFEGDGGFAQNCQDLGTLVTNKLPIKIFLMVNNGYASIRMTQRRYFNGAYLGCDEQTGLGFPDWHLFANSFGLTTLHLARGVETEGFRELFSSSGPALFTVPLDPEQTYYPKIASEVTNSGGMKSSPLHRMDPPLAPHEVAALAALRSRRIRPE